MAMNTELIDGATGTELERRGFRLEAPLWSATAIDDAPELLGSIHREYVEAGATIVTANTFRTNRRSVVTAGRNEGEGWRLTKRAVSIARNAVDEVGRTTVARVAGSIAPVGDSYRPNELESDILLREDHRTHLEALAEAGCDLILAETMNSIAEIRIVLEEAESLGIELYVSLVPDRTGENLLDGTPMTEAIDVVASFDPAAILLNCGSPSATATATRILAGKRREHTDTDAAWSIGAYPNADEPDEIDGYRKMRRVGDEEFDRAITEILSSGVDLIGSCCGTTPATTRRIASILAS